MDPVYELRQLLNFAVEHAEAANVKSRTGRPEERAAAKGQQQAYDRMASRISEWLESMLDAKDGISALNDHTGMHCHLTFATVELAQSFALEFDTGRALATQLPSGKWCVYEFTATGFTQDKHILSEGD